MNIGEGISGAIFSDDRRYRPALWRIWDYSRHELLFIGLNPSRATEIMDDPTIRRVVRFARDNGFGGLYVGNLFDQVTPNPESLDLGRSQAANNIAIKKMWEVCDAALVGWGHFGDLAGSRPAEVLKLIGQPVYCLGMTKDGWPKHPLYIRADTPFIRYERGTT